jgi:hypothetical protein
VVRKRKIWNTFSIITYLYTQDCHDSVTQNSQGEFVSLDSYPDYRTFFQLFYWTLYLCHLIHCISQPVKCSCKILELRTSKWHSRCDILEFRIFKWYSRCDILGFLSDIHVVDETFYFYILLNSTVYSALEDTQSDFIGFNSRLWNCAILISGCMLCT